MATRREDLGSWLEGTPGDSPGEPVSGTGLPTIGPGSLASVPRRCVALAVDWVLSLAISAAFFPDPTRTGLGVLSGNAMATLAVFAGSTVLLVGLLGHTVGHRLLGLQVVRLAPRGASVRADEVGDGARDRSGGRGGPEGGPGLVAALLRTVLLCLVIPAVIWNAHGRGMHDVAAGTAVVRRA